MALTTQSHPPSSFTLQPNLKYDNPKDVTLRAGKEDLMPGELPFVLRQPKGPRRPVLISAPHVGTEIPAELASLYAPEALAVMQDTDWLVHELYGFCVDHGFTLIHARYHRYVVDLNRPTSGPALYQDARRQTDVLPLTDFDGRALYRQPEVLTPDAREERIQRYYAPYHAKIEALLSEMRTERGHVVLFDAHSIRRSVPSIALQPFPDLILGDRDGSSAAPALSQAIRRVLEASPFELSYNQPFKGGQITRGFGQPDRGRHALQLEMSQDLYLQSGRVELNQQKCQILQPILLKALEALDIAVRTLP